MKTITIKDETWKKLSKMKLNLGCETLNEVLERLFNLVTKFKLAGELQ